jgi:putative nucleotidyltransferase with HDIG domain
MESKRTLPERPLARHPGRPRYPLDDAQQLRVALSRLERVLDAYDPCVAEHCRRVRHYVLVIAGGLNLDDERQAQLDLAARLHDIGKICMPRRILHKCGRLSADEVASMQQHASIGELMASRIVADQEVLAAIRHHHERWDGTGYPDGRRGLEISLLARVLAVADGYDAMTSPRSYRAPRTLAAACDELDRVSGTQYDPQIVNAFLAQLSTSPSLQLSIT